MDKTSLTAVLCLGQDNGFMPGTKVCASVSEVLSRGHCSSPSSLRGIGRGETFEDSSYHNLE